MDILIREMIFNIDGGGGLIMSHYSYTQVQDPGQSKPQPYTADQRLLSDLAHIG
jgi:hypothetical protein